MDISAVIFATHRIRLLPDEGKIPWDEPAFSQRMLENHLSQDHDWASRRLTVIEQQVTWITRQLPAGARILDLGCGPGFYTRLLAERGFHCTGVDFSPASITWARQQAQAANLNIDYIQQDIRTYHPTEPFDFIMMTFGELNVFSAADAQSLISHCAQWLKPDGKLLVEVHTFDEVKRQGMAQPGWQRCPHGLFLAVPHLLLTENAWDEEAQTSSTQFWAIAENGCTTRFGSQMKAWRDDEYISLLGDAGFTVLQRPTATPGRSARLLQVSCLRCWLKKQPLLRVLPSVKGITQWISHVFLPLAKANTVSIIRLQRKSTPRWAMRYA